MSANLATTANCSDFPWPLRYLCGMKSKQCAVSGSAFTLADDELEYYRQNGLPEPSLSPIERLRRRFSYRHGGKLYKSTCSGTGKSIISMYPPDCGFPVFEQTHWWSDNWNALDYGREFDFNRPFFEQFAGLYRDVPHLSLLNTNCENSYYTSHALNLKNGYLLFGAADSVDSMYGYFIINCKNVLDGISMHGCELCYDGVSSTGCYNCIGLVNCRNCSDCILTEECHSCSHCIGCVGLRGKSYHVLNIPVGKDGYEQYRRQLAVSRLGGLDVLRTQFSALKSSLPRIAAHQYSCEDSTGDMIINCKGCRETYDTSNSEDCRYMAFAGDSSGSVDCCYNGGGGVRFCYECVSTLGENSRFNVVVWHGSEVEYSMECHSSRNLFGCVGLRQAQFGILNRLYPQTEYQTLRAKIFEHMEKTGELGQMFPVKMSPFAYNDSIANLFFPLTEAQALHRGYRWHNEAEAAPAAGEAFIPPADISDVQDSILEKTLICSASKRPFKINRQELDFYRKLGIPIPRLAPPERHKVRLAARHHFSLYQRTSAVSGKQIDSIYAEKEAPRVISHEEWLNAD